MSVFSNRLKQKREELSMSQEELAVLTGYTSRSSIAKIESGNHDIPLSKVEVFAKALKTTPAFLMGWDTNHTSLYDSEVKLFTIFHSLNPAGQQSLIHYAEFLVTDQNLQKNNLSQEIG